MKKFLVLLAIISSFSFANVIDYFEVVSLSNEHATLRNKYGKSFYVVFCESNQVGCEHRSTRTHATLLAAFHHKNRVKADMSVYDRYSVIWDVTSDQLVR